MVIVRDSTLTLADAVHTAANDAEGRLAIVFPDEQVTYSELRDRVELLARALIGMGVKSGQMVGVLMHNCLDQVVLTFAAGAVGATLVPINNRNRASELAYVINDAQLQVLFVGDLAVEHVDLAARLHEALPHLALSTRPHSLELPDAPELKRVFLLGETTSPGMLARDALSTYAGLVSDETWAERVEGVSPEQPAIMLYTSGTTALPKGCPMRHRQLLDISAQVAGRLGMRDGDRLWDGLPLFHASGIIPMLACVSVRGTFYSQHFFDAGDAVAIMQREDITLAWPAFNTIWQSIITDESFTPETLDHVRAVLCVGPSEAIRVMESAAPKIPLISCYGITEAMGMPIMARFDDDQWTRTETGGRPFDGIEACVRDVESGEALAPQEEGQLWLRGRNVFSGYWRDPVRTAEVFDADGWFCTGDLATISEDGLVSYKGRVKDMLKVGGENVAAVEIEGYLSTHPAVQIVVVVGVPDEKYGEVPAAFVELRAGQVASAEDLIGFCMGRIASFKVPRYVRFVTTWPMSATKIRKVDLQAQLESELRITKSD